MSDQPENATNIYNILVESEQGSNTFTLRETYPGTEEEARGYAQSIANAEGRRVRLAGPGGDEVGMFEPNHEGSEQA